MGEEKRTEFCLEITEEKGCSRGDEFDKRGRGGHVVLRRGKLISLS